MKKLLITFLILICAKLVFAQQPLVCVGEPDGAPDPNALCVWQLQFSNGSVTDNGDGTASVSTGGGSGAPTDADYLVGTANGSLSAEIVVGTSPGGELGNTWASPTIDDSVTVTGWVMGASTATTPAADDNDTSLATTAYVQTEILSLSSEYIILYPGSASITGTMAITADATQGAQIDGSNGGVLLFDATVDEGAAWRFRLPDNWTAHTDLKLMYSMQSGTANEVEWEAAVMCQSAGDSERDDADGFAAIATTVDTVPGTVLFPDTVTITLTDDSCAAGDLMTINVSTDSDDATNDDATGDRRLLGVVYEYAI